MLKLVNVNLFVLQNSYNKVIARDEDGKTITWAPAAMVAADKVSFHGCGFVSLQDTLTDARGRHYFDSCYIEGAIDFIWSDGQSFYKVTITSEFFYYAEIYTILNVEYHLVVYY